MGKKTLIPKDSKFIKSVNVDGEDCGRFVEGNEVLSRWFQGKQELKEIIIPEGFERIQSEAFRDCTSLTTVTLPESLSYIEENAFIGCSALEKVILPPSVENIIYNLKANGDIKGFINLESDDLVNRLKEGTPLDFKPDVWQ